MRRGALFEKLSRIQSSISHGAPLQEVLDAITAGARDLLGDEIVGLRLIDRDDPSQVVLVSQCGVPDDVLPQLRRGPISEGAGGRAIAEDRLVIIDDYARAPGTVPAMAAIKLQAAMAAPVREGDRAVGSLVVASYERGRTYNNLEQEILLAFAEHASLALKDARAVEAMREAQRSKDMFLAMVSHELKTPLTVIIGVLNSLKNRNERMSPKVRDELVSAAHERAQDLARLIERLLQGARGELVAVDREVFLSDVITRAVDGFDQSTLLELGALPEVWLRVDSDALAQVLGVLLENAISHSPPGSKVCVEGRVDADRIKVVVTNPGSLPRDGDLERLFMPFERGHERASPGVGLGLYIANRLADAIGGSLSAESSAGAVSFTLSFPFRPVAT